MNIKEYIKEQRLITDGAMGTYYEEKYSEDTVICLLYTSPSPRDA